MSSTTRYARRSGGHFAIGEIDGHRLESNCLHPGNRDRKRWWPVMDRLTGALGPRLAVSWFSAGGRIYGLHLPRARRLAVQLPELFGDGIGIFAVHDEACDGNGRDVDAFFLERLEDA